MARVKGPLMSMEASGAYGGTLVFAQRKGAAVVRQLVTPANPKSTKQEIAKNIVRVGGNLQKWANATTMKASGQTAVDSVRLAAIAPSAQTWNSYLVQLISGKGALVYAAARAAYTALAAGEKTAWNDAAVALTPALPTTYQTAAGGVATTAMTAGEAWIIYHWGLASVGLSSTPGAVPPTYA